MGDTASHLRPPAKRLQYFTIGYNVVEAIVSIAFGVIGSVLSLVAFGIDSGIEVAASLVVLFRLRMAAGNAAAERVSQRLIAACFFSLGVSVAYHAGNNLMAGLGPESSLPGILIAVASGIVMPVLARKKHTVALEMGMPSLAAEAAQTKLCAYLTYILLFSLVLYRWFGWWWADSAGALLMLPIIFYEGVKAAQGKSCDCH